MRGRAKGFWRFIGVGLVERAELVTQVGYRHDRLFVNYVFDCLLVDLGAENLGVGLGVGSPPGATLARPSRSASPSLPPRGRHGSSTGAG